MSKKDLFRCGLCNQISASGEYVPVATREKTKTGDELKLCDRCATFVKKDSKILKWWLEKGFTIVWSK